jgi:transcriptional regulator with XRE-family HTH domain
VAVPQKPTRDLVASKLVSTLAAERQRQGLSMAAVAEKSGLSLTMISFVERELRHPTLDTLQRIAGSLGVSLGGLLVEAERTTASSKGLNAK